mmetsp:Transcript_41777/g.110570  ORF Transcript_41777/g.110570 Transcript_41777/m.110570 type:complete len:231 (-) Transcript_41777:374-1066(-)
MSTFPVEHRQSVGNINLRTLRTCGGLKLLEFLTTVVIRKIIQLTTCEVTECLDQGGTHVVPVAVKTPSVVLVDVDGRAHKIGQIVGHVVSKPAVEEPVHDGIASRLLLAQYVTRAIGDQAHRVAVDMGHTRQHHIQARRVLAEVPQTKHLQDLEIGHFALLPVHHFQHLPRLLLGDRPSRHHHRRLEGPDGISHGINFFNFQRCGDLNVAKSPGVGLLSPKAVFQIMKLT